jgi:hypothetical protein
MDTCDTCIYYHVKGWKTCRCPKMIYGYGKLVGEPDSVRIEDDEGWGLVPGPKFGCIHHKEKV